MTKLQQAIAPLAKAAKAYLTYLHDPDKTLGSDEFKLLKARIITLACNLHAAQAASLAPPSGGWQPLASAPERRKVFVSWVNALGHRRTTCAAFYPAGTLDLDDAPEDTLNDDGTNAEAGWFECREAGDAVDWHLAEEVTHWMPLPAPPKVTA